VTAVQNCNERDLRSGGMRFYDRSAGMDS
jgi:hypothetical protein